MPYKDPEKAKACKRRYRERNRDKINARRREAYWHDADKSRQANNANAVTYRTKNRAAINARFRKSKRWSRAKYRLAQRQRHDAQKAFVASIKLHCGCQNPNCGWQGELPSYALDCHHIDPSTKVFTVGANVHARTKIIAELRKCVVLCQICHRMHHNGDLDISHLSAIQIDDNGKIIGA